MPPALSDDEASDVELAVPMRGRPTSASRSASANDVVADDLDGTNDGSAGENEDGEDAEDLEEDEFIVEAIKKHMIDEDGSLKFQVKWEGWDAKTDLTWEPEENLRESAEEILSDYFVKLGGRDEVFKQSEAAAKGKKRGRAPSGTTGGVPKRSRTNGLHPESATPSATAKKWSPPAGSWEDDIETIDACEDEGSGKLVVYLIWKNGNKTKHDTGVVYKKCPQKMLQFYERHVKIIRDDNKALAESLET